jgi:NAD(P)-dependent dehydrogenase (short-subunit alcohol dehydrogenase family)
MATPPSTYSTDVDRGVGMKNEFFDTYVESDDCFASLDEKVVAITGTTTGIGVAIAKVAIVKEARMILLLNRESERSKKSEEELKKLVTNEKTEIKSIACDLQSIESVKKAALEVNNIASAHGGLDGAFFSAIVDSLAYRLHPVLYDYWF